ncbi:MAG: hypothetical protein QM658_15780 [Gordonia sp. (in: high G+C Gram-positive bacteria)]|uniref:hypothetical protein n=1 Tax=Gordonia sp. (in: high G+C Gram-positive bacteria) TaxID=84139 RepID=UPI0039E6EED6
MDMKKTTTSALIALTIAAGTTALTAAPAQARVAPGNYWYTVHNNSGTKTQAAVSGNMINIGGKRHRLIQTPRGAYFLSGGLKFSFWQAPHGYDGSINTIMRPTRISLFPR